MKKLSRVLLVIVGLGIVSFVATRHIRSQVLLGSQRVPYLMRVQEHASSNGNVPQQARAYLFAVRSDGSTVRASLGTDVNGNDVVATRTIRDLAAGKRAFVAEAARLITTFFSPSAVLTAKARNHGPNCMPQGATFTQNGVGKYLGYNVVKIREKAAVDTDLEHWAAPDLDCDYIYSKWSFKNSDGSVRQTVEQAAVSIVPGEPPAELFAEKPDLVEKSPSELVSNLAGSSASADEKLHGRLEEMDLVYRNSRAFAPRQ